MKYLELGGAILSDDEKIVHRMVHFIPDENINCNPPYKKGKYDGCWIKYRFDNKIDPTNKKQSERLVGMKLQPIE
ncbi:MAG: hypothetical protein WC516_09960 [Patescibacteria group bacterium]|jgi:hypothetical protein|nr:hypothetical protein [Sideroxydans sp.]